MEIFKNKKVIWITLLTAILLLVVGAYFIFMSKRISKKETTPSTVVSYTVPGVPYFGIYNHKGPSAITSGYSNGYNNGTSCSAALEILEYWNPGQIEFSYACKDLAGTVSDKSGFDTIGTNNFISFFTQKDFSAQEVKLSLTDLTQYINSEIRTPLLLFLPASVDQPMNINYYPTTVLIGVDEKNQKLTFHDFWLGNNYEMTFNDFNKLESQLPAVLQNNYLVIQPKNLNEKLKEISQRKVESYPARTSTMQNAEKMFRNYATGSGGAFRVGLWLQALDYFSQVEKSPNFNDYFPPYFKTMLYYQLAKVYFLKNDLDNALAYAQKAVDSDHDLDKPFKDWPGYEVKYVSPEMSGFAPEPYIILGDILDKKDNLTGALDAYKKASKALIFSSSVDADIQNVEMEMARKEMEK